METYRERRLPKVERKSHRFPGSGDRDAGVVFVDPFGGGKLVTRHQLLRRRADSDEALEDLDADEASDAEPFPAALPGEIGRRMCRNLREAASRREDRLEAMVWAHAELDLR